MFDRKNRIIASSTESDRSTHRAKESTVYSREAIIINARYGDSKLLVGV